MIQVDPGTQDLEIDGFYGNLYHRTHLKIRVLVEAGKVYQIDSQLGRIPNGGQGQVIPCATLGNGRSTRIFFPNTRSMNEVRLFLSSGCSAADRRNYRAIPSLPLDTRLPIHGQRSVPRFLVRGGRSSLRNQAQDRAGRIFLHTLKAACATKAFPRTSIAILGAMKNFRRRWFGCACWVWCWGSYHTGNILGFRLMCYR